MASATSFQAAIVIGILAGVAGPLLETNAQASSWLVYFGTYAGDKSRGIYAASFDSETGILSQPQLAAEMRNPSFLAVHPKRPLLFAVGETGETGGRPEGSVSIYAINRKTGGLTFINDHGSGGTYPCHISVDRTGKCLLISNYGSGSLTALGIDRLGKFTGSKSEVQHQGSSVDPQRQTGPHAHYATMDPGNRFGLVCDLGLDKVMIYCVKPAVPRLTPNQPCGVSVDSGAGPRHLAFHPSGKFVYVLNEMGCTVTLFAYDAKRGTLSQPIQSARTLPEGFKDPNTCAEIQVHPSGRFLYASNRGHNSLAAFAINQSSGDLSLIDFFPSGGKTPRHFALDPSGKWLITENQDSDNVVVLEVDSSTGRLRNTGQVLPLGKPVCAVFVKP
jgi:6-phosphogluconolactonase